MQFREQFEVSGKGTVLIYHMESGDSFPAVGQRIYHDHHEYEVLGVELARHLTAPPQLAESVALVVRKVQ